MCKSTEDPVVKKITVLEEANTIFLFAAYFRKLQS